MFHWSNDPRCAERFTASKKLVIGKQYKTISQCETFLNCERIITLPPGTVIKIHDAGYSTVKASGTLSSGGSVSIEQTNLEPA